MRQVEAGPKDGLLPEGASHQHQPKNIRLFLEDILPQALNHAFSLSFDKSGVGYHLTTSVTEKQDFSGKITFTKFSCDRELDRP